MIMRVVLMCWHCTGAVYLYTALGPLAQHGEEVGDMGSVPDW